MPRVAVDVRFDDPGSRDIRFLQEAARLGEVHARLWSDETIRSLTNLEPRMPEAERLYFLRSIRFVEAAVITEAPPLRPVLTDASGPQPDVWVVDEAENHLEKASYCRACGIRYQVLRDGDLAGFPECTLAESPSGRRKVLVTGSFDWFHSGHVRFFEEVSELGDLYVVVGHDRNIRLLKGEGHPLFPEAERRYLAGSIRFVKQVLVSTGDGWLDAEPEIERLKPDVYVVNEDGDRPEKREYCRAHGIEYVVLKRVPKAGLVPRSSTALRGF